MVQRVDEVGAEFELGYWAIRGLGQPIRFLFWSPIPNSVTAPTLGGGADGLIRFV